MKIRYKDFEIETKDRSVALRLFKRLVVIFYPEIDVKELDKIGLYK